MWAPLRNLISGTRCNIRSGGYFVRWSSKHEVLPHPGESTEIIEHEPSGNVPKADLPKPLTIDSVDEENFYRSALIPNSVEHIDKKIELSSNDRFKTTFVNRNPRNLEMMRLEYKDEGWELTNHKRNYYNKLKLDRSTRHITLSVLHHTGKILTAASTKEFVISKHLYRTRDNSALVNLGRVLSQRCLQFGINYINIDKEELRTSRPLQLLHKVFEECGLSVEEPERIKPPIPPYKRIDWKSEFSPSEWRPSKVKPPKYLQEWGIIKSEEERIKRRYVPIIKKVHTDVDIDTLFEGEK